MLKQWIVVAALLTMLMVSSAVYTQGSDQPGATLRFNGVEFGYSPEAFGAVLPAFEPGTPYQTDAPYFANIAPHTSVRFLRPNPAQPDTNWIGELSVYRISDLNTYAEPSYRAVVDQLRSLGAEDLSSYAGASADYRTPALPFMPVQNAAQVLRSRPTALNFGTMTGIEYYAYFSQAPEPILEGQVLYVYQGITTDGQYYLSFSMPVEVGVLARAIPADMSWDTFLANYPQYLQETFVAINTTDPASFAPASPTLHRFVESITISA